MRRALAALVLALLTVFAALPAVGALGQVTGVSARGVPNVAPLAAQESRVAQAMLVAGEVYLGVQRTAATNGPVNYSREGMRSAGASRAGTRPGATLALTGPLLC